MGKNKFQTWDIAAYKECAFVDIDGVSSIFNELISKIDYSWLCNEDIDLVDEITNNLKMNDVYFSESPKIDDYFENNVLFNWTSSKNRKKEK